MKTSFRLGCIYAEGWNAANGLATSEIQSLDLDRMATLNPYTREPDRSRWTSGFITNALGMEHPVVHES